MPAAIVTFGGEISGKAHTDAVLSCQHVGVPGPNIRWELPDGHTLTPSQKSNAADGKYSRFGIMPDGKLVMRDLGKNDSGNYTCFVNNEHGGDNVSHRLVVKCKTPC